MDIDFVSPSNGTYNNAGRGRLLANYLEHEDLERIEKGIYTEGFFNLTDLTAAALRHVDLRDPLADDA